MRRLLVLVLAVLMVGMLAVTGCTAAPPRPAPTGPPAAPCVPVASSPPNSAGLPHLTLPCLTGGQAGGGQVRLDRLPHPAVVNLWASWCERCRTEMPAIQRYAAANTGRTTVLGVDTGDTRTGGRSVVDDLHIGYPNLFDPHRRLLSAFGKTTLPVTLFVDGAGTVRLVYQGPPLTEQSLTDLATRYLGA